MLLVLIWSTSARSFKGVPTPYVFKDKYQQFFVEKKKLVWSYGFTQLAFFINLKRALIGPSG